MMRPHRIRLNHAALQYETRDTMIGMNTMQLARARIQLRRAKSITVWLLPVAIAAIAIAIHYLTN